MFASHSELITQIHSIIQKNPIGEKDLDIDLSTIEKTLHKTRNNGKRHYYPFLNKNDLKKLEDRMDRLEEQNSQLQCIIHFLFVHLAELTSDFPGTGQSGEELFNGNRASLAVHNNKPLLTKREKEVFNLLAKGLCAKEIAKILFISETTVITHKKNLKEKFHAKNTVELISNILG